MVVEFYACYLLQSQSSPKRVYVGSTPDPVRRFRQHNGEIQGGAKKTQGHRPWYTHFFVYTFYPRTPLLVIYGFPHSIHALQFEWTWQNPMKSRLLTPWRKDLSAAWTLKHKLRVLLYMTKMTMCTKFPLTIGVFVPHVHTELVELASTLDLSVAINLLSSPQDLPLYHPQPQPLPLSSSSTCFICLDDLDHQLQCPHCLESMHMTCLANQWTITDLLPTTGTCPSCLENLQWTRLVFTQKH